jgi:hypothetical protein
MKVIFEVLKNTVIGILIKMLTELKPQYLLELQEILYHLMKSLNYIMVQLYINQLIIDFTNLSMI